MPFLTRLVLSAFIISAALFTAMPCAAAAGLPDYFLIGDTDGLTVSGDGVYVLDVVGLNPGDVITKQLLIRNLEPYAFQLTMRADPMEETGPLHLLDEVRLTLRMDGRLLYDGRARGDEGVNMILNPLNLGTYPSGAYRTLDIILTVDPAMQEYIETSEAFFKWIFYAIRYVPGEATPTPAPPGVTSTPEPPALTPAPEPPGGPKQPDEREDMDEGLDEDSAGDWNAMEGIDDWPDENGHNGPRTGDDLQYGLYIVTAVLSFVSLVLLVLAKRRETRRVTACRKTGASEGRSTM